MRSVSRADMTRGGDVLGEARIRTGRDEECRARPGNEYPHSQILHVTSPFRSGHSRPGRVERGPRRAARVSAAWAGLQGQSPATSS